MKSRTRDKSLATSVCLALILGTAAQALTVFRVATTEDDEAFPSVSGHKVVWQFYDSRYGDWDLELADISNPNAPVVSALTDVPGDDQYPVLDGNDVVWQDNRDGNWEIYGAIVDGPEVATEAKP